MRKAFEVILFRCSFIVLLSTTVQGGVLTLLCSSALASGNPGRSALECVSSSRNNDDVVFRNNCGYKVFIVYCGDMKYSKKKCGDGPKGNGFYTHSNNIGPGETDRVSNIKEYRYAACEGSIGFGKDEVQDSPDGSFTCIASKSKSDAQTEHGSRSGRRAEKEAKQSRNSAGDRQSTPQRQANNTDQDTYLPMDTDHPQLTVSPIPDCPPGSSPARYANGGFMTIPPSALCIRNEDHTPGLDDLRDRKNGNRGNQPPSQQIVGGTTTPGSSNRLVLQDIDPNCNQPGRAYTIGCVDMKCKPGQVSIKGKCVQNISCLPPSVLKDGKCVSPTQGNASSGGSNASASTGRDAAKCIAIKTVPAKNGRVAHQSITNTCSEKIGLIFCHGPSQASGTRSTECGQNGRFYQQFSTVEPGEIKDNNYSMPFDATIQYGACFGGEGKIKQTTNGEYVCR